MPSAGMIPGVHADVLDVGGSDLVFVSADARVADALPAATAETSPRSVRVEAGQTLFAIAREHLGDGARWRDLLDANPGLDPQHLRAGQTLRLP